MYHLSKRWPKVSSRSTFELKKLRNLSTVDDLTDLREASLRLGIFNIFQSKCKKSLLKCEKSVKKCKNVYIFIVFLVFFINLQTKSRNPRWFPFTGSPVVGKTVNPTSPKKFKDIFRSKITVDGAKSKMYRIWTYNSTTRK